MKKLQKYDINKHGMPYDVHEDNNGHWVKASEAEAAIAERDVVIRELVENLETEWCNDQQCPLIKKYGTKTRLCTGCPTNEVITKAKQLIGGA